MIAVPAGLRVLIATKPVDFRRGADGLAALVRETLGEDPFSGTIYVFRSKRADRVKMVAWDGTGLVLLWKRLESGALEAEDQSGIAAGASSTPAYYACSRQYRMPLLPRRDACDRGGNRPTPRPDPRAVSGDRYTPAEIRLPGL